MAKSEGEKPEIFRSLLTVPVLPAEDHKTLLAEYCGGYCRLLAELKLDGAKEGKLPFVMLHWTGPHGSMWEWGTVVFPARSLPGVIKALQDLLEKMGGLDPQSLE